MSSESIGKVDLPEILRRIAISCEGHKLPEAIG